SGTYLYDRNSGTLRDQDGLVWTRVPHLDGPVATVPPEPSPSDFPSDAPTLRPTPSGTPEPTLTADCVDLTQGGTYTAPAGPVTVTAAVPGTPLIPWQGLRDGFFLSGSCGDGSHLFA